MKLLLSISMMLALCSLAGAQTADLVRAELVADTQAIEPGKPFQVALHLTIADGWHVYWINPGDAGAPTTLKLTLPKGFTAGPVQYPVPEKLPQPGNLTVYAYEHELLLIETVTPPADLTGSTFTISANAGWCVCDPEKCVLSKKDMSFDLPVTKTKAEAANQELFAAWRPRMPAKSDEMFSDVHMLSMTGGSIRINIASFLWRNSPPASEIVWIPGSSDDLVFLDEGITTSGHVTTMKFQTRPLQGIPPSSPTISGILAYHIQGEARGVAITWDRKQLDLPVPADPAAAK